MATATPLAAKSTVPHDGQYSELVSRVKDAGLLDRQPVYYFVKIAATVALFAGGWVIFALLGDSWWQLAVAVFLAILFTQFGFLGHDAGHRQIFRTRRPNYIVGLLLGNLGIGLSYGWWIDKHNRHHANPNHDGKDPDIDIGVLAFTAVQARHRTGAVGRFIAGHQAYLFFPLLLLEAVQLHKASVQALLRPGMRNRAWEALTLGLHLAAYLGATLWVLSPGKAVAFIVVHQALFGLYLGCSFAPNHKGMPVFSGNDKVDFLRRQVLTSRNVRGGWFVDFALGGLNYQIEHHLFPSMPRPNLRRSQALIRSFCERHGVSYCETSLWRSYAQALRHLHEMGRPLRTALP